MNIKQYLPMSDKATLVQLVIDNAIDNETKRFNFALLEMYIQFLVVKFYTDIEFAEDKNLFELYEELKLDGTIDEVMGAIPCHELDMIRKCVDRQIEQETKFSLSYIDEFRAFLDKVILAIPDEKGMKKLSKGLLKDFNKLDPSKLEFVKDFLKANNPQ